MLADCAKRSQHNDWSLSTGQTPRSPGHARAFGEEDGRAGFRDALGPSAG